MEWLFSDEKQDRKRQKEEFGEPLGAFLKPYLKKLGFKPPTGVSKRALETKPIHKQPFHLLNIGPTLSVPVSYLRASAPELAKSPALIVSVRYDEEPMPAGHAKTLSEAFPETFFDTSQKKWFTTTPYAMTNSRTRVDFVTNLNSFIKEKKVDREAVGASCLSVVTEIISKLQASAD